MIFVGSFTATVCFCWGCGWFLGLLPCGFVLRCDLFGCFWVMVGFIADYDLVVSAPVCCFDFVIFAV